jgi:hypothetical protein
MLIIALIKAIRDIWVESLELRSQLAKRYPGAAAE